MKRVIILGCAVLALASCNRKGCTDPAAENYDSKAKKDDGSCIVKAAVKTVSESEKKSALLTYSNIVHANYEDALTAAKSMQKVIATFVTTPTSANMDAAKKAWLDAREPYGQTEAFRFANGPIDDADGPEGLLNAWPLDENYVDYVKDGSGFSFKGIINDTVKYKDIDKTLLEDLNEKGGEANVSVGYHAIEFLLWGQDLDANGPGARSVDDFDAAKTGTMAKRRGVYINLCADLIVQHLQSLVDEWKDGGTYRTVFLAKKSDDALKEVLTGIGVLSKSELASERMFTALKKQDQEEEHSCFSDNTHRDIITNAMGIENVFLGTYKRTDGSTISGTSIKSLVASVNADLATKTADYISSSVAKTKAISIPFDQAILKEAAGGSGPIMTSITELQTSGDKIAECAKAIGITISTDLPE